MRIYLILALVGVVVSGGAFLVGYQRGVNAEKAAQARATAAEIVEVTEDAREQRASELERQRQQEEQDAEAEEQIRVVERDVIRTVYRDPELNDRPVDDRLADSLHDLRARTNCRIKGIPVEQSVQGVAACDPERADATRDAN